MKEQLLLEDNSVYAYLRRTIDQQKMDTNLPKTH